MTGKRYAIYFAPPQRCPLDRLAMRWLGRDAYTGERLAPAGLGAIGAVEQEAMAAEPRHYGFHATLKPPFALREGRTAAELLEAAEAFARANNPVTLAGLRTARIGRFVALVPVRASERLDLLAAGCIREFDAFRAPPGEAELARRRSRGLTPRQEELLLAWGYPYVMEEFRFHLTLTGPLPDEVSGSAIATLAKSFDPLCGSPFPIDSISVFEQVDTESPFTVLRRFELGAPARAGLGRGHPGSRCWAQYERG